MSTNTNSGTGAVCLLATRYCSSTSHAHSTPLTRTTFIQHYGEIAEIIPDRKIREWRFNLMLNKKTFNAIPNWIIMNGRKLSVIVFRKETSLLALQGDRSLLRSCTGKKPTTSKDVLPQTLYQLERRQPRILL